MVRWGTGEMKDAWKGGDWGDPLDLPTFHEALFWVLQTGDGMVMGRREVPGHENEVQCEVLRSCDLSSNFPDTLS